MSNKQQTAVEWLEEIYLTTGINRNVHFNQAKLMEKQQIIDAHFERYDSGLCGVQTGDEYYKETYE